MRFRRITPRTIVTGLLAVGVLGVGACGHSHGGDHDASSTGVGGIPGSGGAAGLGAGGMAGGRAGSAGSAGNAPGGDAGSAGRSGGGASGSVSAGAAGVEQGGRAGTSGAAGAGASSLGGYAGSSAGLGCAPGEAGQGGDAGAEAICMLDAPPQACEATDEFVSIDFATYTADGRWGGETYLVSGSTTLYHARGGEDFTVEALNGELHVSGRVPSHGSSGIALRFDSCVNASSTYAFYFSVRGDLGNAELKFLAQTNTDYPIDVANHRGACALTGCDTGRSACQFPWVPIPVSPTSGTAGGGFNSFAGGSPEGTVSFFQDLVGFEFQVTCLSECDCPVSFTLGAITPNPL